MARKKAVIFGCVGYPNIGDILISERLRNILDDILGVESTFISQHKVDGNFSGENFRFRSISDLPKLVRLVIDSDLVIIGGGGLFTDITGLPMLLYYILGIWLARAFRKKVICLGISTGPFKKTFSALLTKASLRLCDKIILRDPSSKELLENLGLKSKDLIVTTDLVCGMKSQEMIGVERTNNLRQITMGISLRETLGDSYLFPAYLKWKYRHLFETKESIKSCRFVDRFTDFLIELNKRYEANFLYFPMNLERDVDMYHRIKANLPDSVHLDLETYADLSFEELSKSFAKADFFIGMPLHSIILASMLGVPFLAISYSDKVYSYVTTLNGEDWLLSYDTFGPAWLNDALTKFDNLVRNRNKIGQKLLVKRNEFGLIDMKHIELLDKVFAEI